MRYMSIRCTPIVHAQKIHDAGKVSFVPKLPYVSSYFMPFILVNLRVPVTSIPPPVLEDVDLDISPPKVNVGIY